MIRRRPRMLPTSAATAAVLVVAGCGGGDREDERTRRQAEAALVKANAAMQTALSRSSIGRPASSWEPVLKAVRDPTCHTGNDEEDGYRMRSSAALSVVDRGTDGDGIKSAVLGSLLRETFDGAPNVGDLDDDPVALVPVTYRSGADVVHLDVIIERAPLGWTFVVTGRTACLPPA